MQEGLIETPCALIVESIDRLGRDELGKAQTRFQSLLTSGVTVVTLSDNQVYTPESANDLGRIMICLVNMHRAHEESQVKSNRSAYAWDKCREGDIAKMGGIVPGWLKRTADRKGFELIPERVEVVQRIFHLAATGFGSMAIARKLNEEGVKSFTGQQWSAGCLSKMLTRRTVLGEWQPRKSHIVEGKKRFIPHGEPLTIYPGIIDQATWAKVQADRRGRNRGGLKAVKVKPSLAHQSSPAFSTVPVAHR